MALSGETRTSHHPGADSFRVSSLPPPAHSLAGARSAAMTTPPIVVSSTLAHQRMDRLRDLFGQIEREFGDLIEENAECTFMCVFSLLSS